MIDFPASGLKPTYVQGQDNSQESSAIIVLYEYDLGPRGCYLCRTIVLEEPEQNHCAVCHAQFVFLPSHFCFACAQWTKTHYCVNCGVNQSSDTEIKILTLFIRVTRDIFKLKTRSGIITVADATTFFHSTGKLHEIATLFQQAYGENWIHSYETEGILPSLPVKEDWCHSLLQHYRRKEPLAK